MKTERLPRKFIIIEVIISNKFNVQIPDVNIIKYVKRKQKIRDE